VNAAGNVLGSKTTIPQGCRNINSASGGINIRNIFCSDRNRSARLVIELIVLDSKPSSTRLIDSVVALSAKTSIGKLNRTIPTRPISTIALNDLFLLFDFINVLPLFFIATSQPIA
jgi:hypothetical protein